MLNKKIESSLCIEFFAYRIFVYFYMYIDYMYLNTLLYIGWSKKKVN